MKDLEDGIQVESESYDLNNRKFLAAHTLRVLVEISEKLDRIAEALEKGDVDER